MTYYKVTFEIGYKLFNYLYNDLFIISDNGKCFGKLMYSNEIREANNFSDYICRNFIDKDSSFDIHDEDGWKIDELASVMNITRRQARKVIADCISGSYFRGYSDISDALQIMYPDMFDVFKFVSPIDESNNVAIVSKKNKLTQEDVELIEEHFFDKVSLLTCEDSNGDILFDEYVPTDDRTFTSFRLAIKDYIQNEHKQMLCSALISLSEILNIPLSICNTCIYELYDSGDGYWVYNENLGKRVFGQ